MHYCHIVTIKNHSTSVSLSRFKLKTSDIMTLCHNIARNNFTVTTY